MRIVSAVEFKKYIAGICIFCIIIIEFYYKQELCSVILLLVDKYLEKSFYDTILLLGLAICLRIKNNRELLLDAKEII